MDSNSFKLSIINGKYDDAFSLYYPDIAAQRKRYAEAIDGFEAEYGKGREIRIFSAPGRSEIIGNHTDHQHGMAIAAAVNLDIAAIVSENGSDIINIKSKGYSPDIININEPEAKEEERTHSASLIRGIVSRYTAMGYKIKGFDAYTVSDVLKGSGLSSSAAFEVLVASIINILFLDSALSPIEIAKMSQYAENVYFGKPCGLLDQTAAASGSFVFIDFANTEAPKVEKMDFDIAQSGYSLCIVDTGGNHSDLTDDYADIFSELKELCTLFGKEFLRQIPKEEFLARLPELNAKISQCAIIRAMHVYDENERVLKMKKAINAKDIGAFLKLIGESGNSSYKYIQNAYSLSAPQAQGIPLALKLTEDFLQGDGACRVHGGGFAGTILSFIPTGRVAEYKEYIERVFGKNKCHIINIRPAGGIEIK